MTWNIVEAGDSRYVSDFLTDFAPGVWNKQLADTGGSHLLITNDINYVLVVPNVDLVKSLIEDGSVYPIFGVYAGITEYDFNSFVRHNSKPKKIVSTWDSLYKVIRWINPSEYQLCIDEYHLVLESVGFRYSAINKMMELINQFKNVRYISATPNQDHFEFSILQDLPHYKIHWNNTYKIHPDMHKSNNVIIDTCYYIDSLLNGNLTYPDADGVITKVEELYIFLNSVKTIEQICRTLDLDESDVKICCAVRKRNRHILDKYQIDDVTAPNKKINFFTSKCFQGCNLYTKNGLVILVADTKSPSLLIDMSTQGVQIAGRIRKKADCLNCFRNALIYIYSTNNKINKEELDKVYTDRLRSSEAILKDFSNLSDDAKAWIIDHINDETDFIVADGDEVYISEDKKNYAQYQNFLRTTYKNDYTVIGSLNKDAFEIPTSTNYIKWSATTAKQLAKVKMVTYKSIVTDYFNSEDPDWLTEYPELVDYKKYLTLKQCSSLFFVKDKLIARVEDTKKSWEIMKNLFSEEKFYSSADIKNMLTEKFKEMEINIPPRASLIEVCPFLKVSITKKKIGKKTIKGYDIARAAHKFVFEIE